MVARFQSQHLTFTTHFALHRTELRSGFQRVLLSVAERRWEGHAWRKRGRGRRSQRYPSSCVEAALWHHSLDSLLNRGPFVQRTTRGMRTAPTERRSSTQRGGASRETCRWQSREGAWTGNQSWTTRRTGACCVRGAQGLSGMRQLKACMWEHLTVRTSFEY